jgi:hypothetical protein
VPRHDDAADFAQVAESLMVTPCAARVATRGLVGLLLATALPTAMCEPLDTRLGAPQVRVAEAVFPDDVVAASSPPPGGLERARTLRPDAVLRHLRSTPTREGAYVWSAFAYAVGDGASRNADGVVYVLWRRDGAEPAWALDWHGDLQPHAMNWVDLDGDGQEDLLLHAGYEDVASTSVYRWQVSGDGYATDALVLAYANRCAYAALVDLDGDGRPEILDAVREVDSPLEGDCVLDNEPIPEIPEPVGAAIRSTCRSLAGRFESANVDFNLPDQAPMWNLRLFDPVRIVHIEPSGVVDVTDRFPGHLAWRWEQLATIRAAHGATQIERIDAVMRYLESRIAHTRGAPVAEAVGASVRDFPR